MSTYVPDVSSLRWVIISPKRIARPDEFAEKEKTCPFCPGNEKINDKEVLRYGNGESGEPGWTVRVISNKFPITDFHEVVIHSPDELKDVEDLDVSHVELIFKAYRDRFNFLKKTGSVLIFCNHGEHAGASVKHPHSQIVVIPKQITIDALIREPLNNMIDETPFFNMYCPEFSQWPYEVWIAPKTEKTTFGHITDEEIIDISKLLQRMIRRLRVIYNGGLFSSLPFGYNYYIYPKENWYLRIIPRFIHKAGFELGTGLNVNIVDPKTAAADLRTDMIITVLDKLKQFQEK